MNIKRWNRLVNLAPATVIIMLLGGCTAGGMREEDRITHTVTQADIDLAKSTQPLGTTAAVLWVNGLGCPLCASNIDRQLKRVDGVTSIIVDLSRGKVTLGLLPGKQPSPARLGAAVEDAGFTLVKIEPGAMP